MSSEAEDVLRGTGVRIRDYRPGDAGAFRRLNEEWLEAYFRVEPKDRELFADPVGQIVRPGGAILIVEETSDTGAEPIGCAALIRLDERTFELAKMAVTERRRGRGLGRRLLSACVERARSAGAARLFLETNSRLIPAVSLYRSFGFVEVPSESAPPSDYARVDLFMELEL